MGNVSGFNHFGGGRAYTLDDLRMLGGAHLLGALTRRNGPELMRELEGFDQLDLLRDLAGEYARCGAMSPQSLAQMMKSGMIPPQGLIPRPGLAHRGPASSYASPASFEHAAGDTGLERFLHDNPDARQLVEMALGGRILPGAADGGLRVQPFAPGSFPGGGRENTAAMQAQAMLADLSRAGGGDLAFRGMLLQGLARMAGADPALSGKGSGDPESLSGIREQGRSPFVDWSEDSPNMARRRNMGSGRGAAAAMMAAGPGNLFGPGPGQEVGMSAQACQSGPGAGGACGPGGCGGGDDIGAVLNDGGLTVEDKITLMIMMIMKKMDQDIERQANYINSLQQQQQGGGGGGKGGGGKGGGGGAPSIDVETMKLKRLIDKRSQMFDMLRQIIDKYNQTAKGIIDSMGR